MASISGSVTIAGDPDDWIACAFDAATHAFAGVAAVSGGAYEITGLTAGKAYMVACRPKTGPVWAASTGKGDGDLIIPTDPETTPYIYRAAPSDPLTADVSLLLHCNGTNGSTTFTDETGKTMTASGTASIATAQSKFGSASGYFNGGHVYTPNASGFVFGSGNFALECFFRWSGNTASFQYLISRYDTSTSARIFGLSIDYGTVGKLSARASSTGTSADIAIIGTTTLSADTWYHAAFVRNGTTFRLYLDGGLEAETTSSASLYESASTRLAVGAQSNGSFPFYGHLDEVRVTKAGRYASTFSPPTAEFVLGKTGSSEPTWPTTPGNTVADGDVTWTNMGALIDPIMRGPVIAA
jgi:hypothetical protein